MPETMTKEERDAIDAKVLGYVAEGADPYDAALVDRVAFVDDVERSLARLKRAGRVAYDRGARKWAPVGTKPKAKRAPKARGKAAHVARHQPQLDGELTASMAGALRRVAKAAKGGAK